LVRVERRPLAVRSVTMAALAQPPPHVPSGLNRTRAGRRSTVRGPHESGTPRETLSCPDSETQRRNTCFRSIVANSYDNQGMRRIRLAAPTSFRPTAHRPTFGSRVDSLPLPREALRSRRVAQKGMRI
jgi:hypothetical protein